MWFEVIKNNVFTACVILMLVMQLTASDMKKNKASDYFSY